MSVTCVSLSCLSHLIRLRGLVNFERSHEKCSNVELGPFGFDWSRPEGVWHSHRSALSLTFVPTFRLQGCATLSTFAKFRWRRTPHE